MELRQVNIYDLIDRRRIGRRQCFMVAFCTFLMLFEASLRQCLRRNGICLSQTQGQFFPHIYSDY